VATKRVIIGQDWGERYPLTDEHKAELKEAAGVDEIDGWPPYEIIEDDGKIFVRGSYNKASYGEADRMELDKYFYSTDDKQMMCNCLSKSFEVRFENSGVICKCTKCGDDHEFSW
jgi:hypothetical protein